MKTLQNKISTIIFGVFLVINCHAQPIITTQPTNQFGVVGGAALFCVNAAGAAPFTFQWIINGTNFSATNIITTVAGSGVLGGSFSDGDFATNTSLISAVNVAIDAQGNLLIVDSGHSRIRKVDANGIISTIAGTNSSGFSGDGGAATNATLSSPIGIAVDQFGNFFICDNGRIRKVDTNGIITTVAGTNGLGFSGDGGPALNAKFFAPRGITVDGYGNLFVADSNNYRIRKIDTNGIITTVAGTNMSGYFGDGGPAVKASLSRPTGVSIDKFGNLIIADTDNNVVRRVNTNGIITTIAGNGNASFTGDGGSAVIAGIYAPSRAIYDAYGNLLIASNSRIRKVATNGIISTIAGTNSLGYSGDGGVAVNARLNPTDLALDTNGNLFIADENNSRIRKIGFVGSQNLQLSNLTTNDTGSYQVIITSPSGSVTSSVVSLSVSFISAQPTYTNVPFGTPASLSVAVSDPASFSYQWFVSSGRIATAVPYINSGRLQFVVITDYGAGYSSVPQVHFSGGSGSGAAATAMLSISGGVIGGSVVNINVTSQGSGYAIAPPIVQIDPPSPVLNVPLLNQTNATLVISAVTNTDITNYFVVVTSNYGSITSATVPLDTYLPPQNLSASSVAPTTNSAGGVVVRFTGSPYYYYILQATTNLASPISWQPINTNYPDGNSNWYFMDGNVNTSQKFYRAIPR